MSTINPDMAESPRATGHKSRPEILITSYGQPLCPGQVSLSFILRAPIARFPRGRRSARPCAGTLHAARTVLCTLRRSAGVRPNLARSGDSSHIPDAGRD